MEEGKTIPTDDETVKTSLKRKRPPVDLFDFHDGETVKKKKPNIIKIPENNECTIPKKNSRKRQKLVIKKKPILKLKSSNNNNKKIRKPILRLKKKSVVGIV